jgi:hypothetical protein
MMMCRQMNAAASLSISLVPYSFYKELIITRRVFESFKNYGVSAAGLSVGCVSLALYIIGGLAEVQ